MISLRSFNLAPKFAGGHACPRLLMLAISIFIGDPGAVLAKDRAGATFNVAKSDQTLQLDALQNRIRHLNRRIDELTAEKDRLATEFQELEEFLSPTATAYRNTDGKVDRDERHLGPATFILSADRMGKPRSLELDHALMIEMCGDAEGCLATFGLTGVVIAEEVVEAMFTGRPCGLHLDRTEGTWALSGSCASADLPLRDVEGAPGTGHPAWGRDGDAKPLDSAKWDTRLIFSFGNACFLSEAAPKLPSGAASQARLNRDTKRGLFLIAAGTKWDPTGEFPSDLLPMSLRDPTYQCRLTIRD